MHYRLFIVRTHEAGHHIIRCEELEYDHTKDQLLSTGGRDPHHQLMGLMPDVQKVYLLGDWRNGTNGSEWDEALRRRLARVRKTIEDCKQVG